MTTPRKLGIAAVLVVVVPGLVVLIRDSSPPITATFVRYRGATAVIRITNKSKAALYYGTNNFSITVITSSFGRFTNSLAPFESCEVDFPGQRLYSSPYGVVNVLYIEVPSKFEISVWRLARKIGRDVSPKHWTTNIMLPPQNPPLP